jgi:hypothetical protein
MTPSDQVLVELFRATVSQFWADVETGRNREELSTTVSFMHATLLDMRKEAYSLDENTASEIMDMKEQVHRHMLSLEKGPNSRYGYNGPFML